MDKVWVVQGSTGEYSDHCEWPVCFFENEEDAKVHVEFISAMARQAKVIAGTDHDWERERKSEEFMKQFDPGYATDYTGTNYECFPVNRGPKPEPKCGECGGLREVMQLVVKGASILASRIPCPSCSKEPR